MIILHANAQEEGVHAYLVFETAIPSARTARYLSRPAPRIAPPCSTMFLMSVSGRQVNGQFWDDKNMTRFGRCLNLSKARFSEAASGSPSCVFPYPVQGFCVSSLGMPGTGARSQILCPPSLGLGRSRHSSGIIRGGRLIISICYAIVLHVVSPKVMTIQSYAWRWV